MKKNILGILLSAVLLTFFSCGNNRMNQGDDSKEVAEEQNDEKFSGSEAKNDAEFAVAVADDGMLEVQLGQLAATNASSQQVKEFGKMMVDDHSKANNELKALAQQKGITLPTSLSDKSKRKYDELVEKRGREFDEKYMDMMVKAHKEDIEKFKDEAEDGNDPDIKTWAAGKVPVLQRHLEHAQNIQDALEDNDNARQSADDEERG